MKNDYVPFSGKSISSFVALLLSFNVCIASAQLVKESVPKSATLQAMREAWAKRTGTLDSLAIHFDIDEIIKGVGKKKATRGDALFAEPKPVEDLHSKVALDYYFENGKMAFNRYSSKVMDLNDPTITRPQKIQYSFEGSKNCSLCVETLLPMGSIDVEASPSQAILTNLDYLAVSLWRDPKTVLEKIGYSYDDMVLDEKNVVLDGMPCKRVSIPRKGSKSMMSKLDVSDDGNFLPLQWQTWVNGRLQTKLTVKFVNDKQLGSRISEWSYMGHDSKGVANKTRRGKVDSFKVGEDIVDSKFEIDFPAGTHVIKTDAGKRTYFKQNGDKLVPIEKKDFGKLPTPDGLFMHSPGSEDLLPGKPTA